MYGLYDVCDRNLCVHGLYCLGESGLYGLCRWNFLQYDHQCGSVYSVCDMCCRHLSIDRVYDDCESSVYFVRGGIHLQHNHQRGFLYSLCDGVRRRNHLSVYCLYCHDQSRMYGMYGVCCWNLSKYDLYGLGQHGVYFLRGGNNV